MPSSKAVRHAQTRRTPPRSPGLTIETIALLAIGAIVALGTLTSEGHSAERPAPRGQAPAQIKGTLAAAEATAGSPEQSKIAIVMRPLDLKALPADAFDDGAADSAPAQANAALR